MRLYSVDTDKKEAVFITECASSIAEQISNEINEAVHGNLWTVDELEVMDSSLLANLQKRHSMRETYDLVMKHGKKYIAKSEEHPSENHSDFQSKESFMTESSDSLKDSEAPGGYVPNRVHRAYESYATDSDNADDLDDFFGDDTPVF